MREKIMILSFYRFIRTCIPVVFMLCFRIAGFSQDVYFGSHCYFVSPGGNDLGTGTETDPWKTIQKAAETIEAGDTAVILGGIYNISHEITFKNSGSDTAWITFMAMPGDTVIIDALNHVLDLSAPGPPYDRDQGALMVVDVSYLRIRGLTVRNSRNSGITIRRSHHIEIKDNTTINTFDSGINAWENSQYLLITGNTVFKPNQFSMGQDANGNIVTVSKAPHEGISIGFARHFEVSFNHVSYGDKEGIDVKGPSRYGKVHDNYVHHHDNHPYSVGIYVDAWTDSLYNVEIYDNVIHDCGDGVQIQSEDSRVVQNIYVHHNLCYNFHWSGLGVSNNSADIGQDIFTSDVIFRNNTVYNANDGFWLHGNIKNILVENNIIAASRRYQVDNRAGINTESQNIIFQYNQFSKEPTVPCENCIYSDSGFINPPVADFRLLPGAPGINAGNPREEFNDPDGTRNDLGYQYFSDYPYLTIRPWNPVLSWSEQTDTFEIITNISEFSITDTTEWLDSDYTNSSFIVHASENKTGEDRLSIVQIIAGVDTQYMEVTQKYYIPVESFELRNCPDGPLTAGSSQVKFFAKISPMAASNQHVLWSSSNSDVVSIDNQGLATALSGGEAWIIARVEYENMADSCLVIVNFPVGIETAYHGLDIRVAPNPTADQLNIMNIPPGVTIESVIFDLSGRPVLSNSGDHVLHLQNLKHGLYILKIRCSAGGTIYRKIIKE